MKVLGLFIGVIFWGLFYAGSLGEFGYSKRTVWLIALFMFISIAGFTVWMTVPF